MGMKDKEIDSIVQCYAEIAKDSWFSILSKHGYVKVESDFTDDGKWHGEVRPLGRVAFWKQEGLDGVVVGHKKIFYEGHQCHEEGINLVGDSYNYFSKLHKEKEKANAGVEKIFGLYEKRLPGKKEKIKVNGKEYNSVKLDYIIEFNQLLQDK